jgi:PAS domain S-box-containing protein
MSSAVVVGEIVFDAAGKPIDCRIIDANSAFARLIGRGADQLVGRLLSEVRPGLWPDLLDRAGRVATSGQPEEFEQRDAKSDRSSLIRLSRVGSASLMATIEDTTDAHRAEAVLDRNAFIESIIASTGDGLVVFDRDLRMSVWNTAIEEITGWTADQILGRKPRDVFREEIAGRLEEIVAGIIATGDSRWIEFELDGFPSGRTGWARAVGRAHRDAGGQVVGVVASIRDITTRRGVEDILRAQAGFVEELLEAIPSPIVAKDRDGRVTLCNTAYAAGNYGLTREEVIGKTNRELGQPEAAMHLEHDRKAIASGMPEVYEADRFLANGTVRRHIVVKAPLRSESGEITGTVTADQDITERHAAEQALRQSEERFRTLFDVASDAIFIHDIGGKFVEVNHTACERLGYSRDEFLTMSPSDIDAPEFAPLIAEREEALAGQGSAFFEGAHMRKDGTVVPVELSATVIDLGGCKSILSIARDISERRRAETERNALEDQLRQAQKTEEIGRLAGGIAHDFNNLLTAIRGNASLALAELPPDGVMREELEEIEQAADRAAGLTRQLLTFARRTVLKPEVIDLGAVTRSLEPMLRRVIGENITFVTVIPKSPVSVLADRGQVEQVVVNLSVNARDAMRDGGTLTIEIGEVEDAEAGPADRMATLSVSDSGVGMDTDVMQHLFEPFFTTKNPGEGTGLGLATVYGIVRQAGGTITARSEPGRGSTFMVCLPRVEETASAASEPGRPSAKGGSRTGTILIVEDDSGVRGFTSRVLQTAGYRVLTASDGATAIQTWRQGPAELLITDVVMPGMNGREVAAQLSAAQPGIRVLYISGYADKVIVHDQTLEPNTELLAKPFTAEALLEAVDRAMAAPPPRTGPVSPGRRTSIRGGRP